MGVWSWLSFPSVCLIAELACSNHVGCFIASYGGIFWKLLPGGRRQLKSLHPRNLNSGQVLCCTFPFEATSFSNAAPQRAHSRSRKWAVCVRNDWAAHEVEPSLMCATPTIACALRKRFISSLARWCRLAKREASCMRDGTLYSGSRKESSRTKAA